MTTNNTPAPTTPQTPAPVKAKDPYKGYNIALYVGSAFIIIAAFFFASTAGEYFIAPTLLTITTILYLAGIGLYKSVDYLKPVAKAFSISGLAMVLFWPFAFATIGFSDEVSGFISCLIFTIMSYATALVFNEYLLGYLSYLSTFALVVSFQSLLHIGTGSYYVLGIGWMIISMAIAALWYNRVTWLPIPFRKATRSLSRLTTPLICSFFALSCLTIHDAPFAATLVFVLALAQFWYGYMKDHSANKVLAIRFMIQASIYALVYDLLSVAPMKTGSFALGLTLFITSSMQLAYSLFIDRPKNAIAANENAMTIIAVFGLLWSTTFFGSLSGAQQAVVRIISYAVIAGFGIGLSYKHKRAGWLTLPFLAALILPLELGLNIFNPRWTEWAYMGAYSLISVLFTVIYAGIRNFKNQQDEVFNVVFGSTFIALLAVVSVCFYEKATAIGWLIATIILLAQVFIRGKKELYEIPLYTGALCLYAASNEIFGNIMNHHAIFGPAGQELDLIRSVVGVHILAAAPAIAAFWKEREKKYAGRAIAAYYMLSIVVLFDAWIFRIAYDSIGLALFFLVEQVLLMIVGIIWHRDWLTNSAIVFSFLVVFYMSTGYGYLWLFVIGLALITGVVMKLTHAHNNQATSTPVAPADPAAPAPAQPKIEKAPTAHIVTETAAEAAPVEKAPATDKPADATNKDSASPNRLGGKPHSAKYN